jgi:hypothetical protein
MKRDLFIQKIEQSKPWRLMMFHQLNNRLIGSLPGRLG